MSSDFIYTSRAKDAVLHFLQTAFASENLFEGGNPYLYSSDEKSSRIMIADFNTENLNSIQVKPAMLVVRGQMFPRPLGVGDKNKQTFIGAYETRELLLNINMTVNCYAREGLEAERLAVVVFKLFRFLNEDIQKNYEIFDVSAQGIGGETPAREQLVMVPVILTLAVPDAIKINFNEIQLNKLVVNHSETYLSDEHAR